jgi:hypothetical protein
VRSTCSCLVVVLACLVANQHVTPNRSCGYPAVLAFTKVGVQCVSSNLDEHCLFQRSHTHMFLHAGRPDGIHCVQAVALCTGMNKLEFKSDGTEHPYV